MQEGPGLLDWVSGLVVPILLGALTLFVAIWAGGIAKTSNALAATQHRELKADAARRLRVSLAHELSSMSGRMVAARMSGMDVDAVIQDDLEGMQRLQKASFDSDEATGKKLTAWASLTARKADLPRGDFDAWVALSNDLSEMINLWLRDPEAAIAAIDADMRFKALSARI